MVWEIKTQMPHKELIYWIQYFKVKQKNEEKARKEIETKHKARKRSEPKNRRFSRG